MAFGSSIKVKLAVAFSAVLAVAIVIGAVGIIGSQIMGREFDQVANRDLPQAEAAAELERIVAALELMVSTYQLQPEFDAELEDQIWDLAAQLKAMVERPEFADLRRQHADFSAAMLAAMQSHKNSADLFFVVGEGQGYRLSEFLRQVAVENERFLKQISTSAKVGVFNSVETDPQATMFGNWRAGFSTNNEGLAQLIESYAAAEAEMLDFVATKLLPDPKNAKSLAGRMAIMTTPKMRQALATLTEELILIEETSEALRLEALDGLWREMGAFQFSALERQDSAAEEMHASVVHAARTGKIVTRTVFGVLAVGVLLTLAAMVVSTRIIGRPLSELSAVLRNLSSSDPQEQDVPYLDRSDEIGEVASAAEDFRLALIRQRELESEAARESQAAIDARSAAEQKANEAEEARNEAELSRKLQSKKSEIAEAFFISFSRVVSKAEKGVFDERLGVRFNDPDYDELAVSVNRMLKSIEGSFWETGQVVGDLASGRLETELVGEYEGTFSTLQRDINSTALRLREVVQNISSASGAISSDSSILSQQADQLSKRSTSQAAALEESHASINQVTQNIGDNVAGAGRVAKGAVHASEQAQIGQQVVTDAVSAMTEIEDSAKQVAQIVDVIDDISFQTNLLALNAGVEAARAGDAGKGFAVVAQEVRHLASRASEAARNIGDLIGRSAQDVDKGAALVKQTGEVLDNIVTAFSEVKSTAEEIASSSEEQAESIQGVAASIADLDHITQGNATAAEETATAVLRLNDQTQRLEELIGFFRDENGALKKSARQEQERRKSDWQKHKSAERRKEAYVGAATEAAQAQSDGGVDFFSDEDAASSGSADTANLDAPGIVPDASDGEGTTLVALPTDAAPDNNGEDWFADESLEDTLPDVSGDEADQSTAA